MNLTIELVPSTCWWSNVRSNVTRSQWEKCKRYSKTKTDQCCIICGGSGLDQGKRYATEAHEIWEYDDGRQIQTLVDIWPLCPMCHQVKHIERTRTVSNFYHFQKVLTHFKQVNGWRGAEGDAKVERAIYLAKQIWHLRSQHRWELDISFLDEIGVKIQSEQVAR